MDGATYQIWVQCILAPYAAAHNNKIYLLQDMFSIHLHYNSISALNCLWIEVDFILAGTLQSCNQWTRASTNHSSSTSERRAMHGWWHISKGINQHEWILLPGFNMHGTEYHKWILLPGFNTHGTKYHILLSSTLGSPLEFIPGIYLNNDLQLIVTWGWESARKKNSYPCRGGRWDPNLFFCLTLLMFLL